MYKVCAIIVAAGKGKRMSADINKQFLKLKNKPILYYTLKAFESSELIDSIILVTSKEEKNYCQSEIIEKYKLKKVISVVEGGNERQDSVYNGLKSAKGFDIVVIHDGARPFVKKEVIDTGITYAIKFGASACGVPPKDTIKVRNEKGFSINTLDRNTLFVVQTPQCFSYDLILNCHEKIVEGEIKVTDDTSIVEYFGHKVFLYEGSYSNIKITTPEDLIIGEKILDNMIVE